MTKPDTLASLIAKMPHNSTFMEHIKEACYACQLQAALDALAEKWRTEWRDGKDEPEKRQHQLFGKLECADELDGTVAELRGRGASET